MLPALKTILYASDLNTERIPQAYRMAQSIANQFEAHIVFLHVLETHSAHYWDLITGEVSTTQADIFRKSALDALHQGVQNRIRSFWETEHAGDRNPEERVAEGDVAATIVRVAEEIDADMIVLETHHHTGLGERLLGTIAHKTLHLSRRPVLMVPRAG